MQRTCLSFFFLIITLSAAAQMDSLQSYYQQSLAAYKSGDYETFLKYASLANDIRPNHPTLAYNIASAYALNNHKEKAIEALKSCISMNATDSFLEDEDFANLHGDPRFTELKSWLQEKQKRITNSKIEFTIDQKDIHFESIASGKSGIFLGGVRSKAIYRYRNNQLEPFITPDEAGLYSVMGLGVDDKRKVLWACTAALPEMENYTDSLQGKSTLMAFSLKDGKLLKSFRLEKAILGDLIVTSRGEVITSDGMSNRLFIADPDSIQLLLDLSETVLNLQGLAIDEKRNRLYISDYLTGIYRVDIGTKTLTKVNPNRLYSDKGADGLLFNDNRLIAFKNGTSPKRTIVITLNESGDMAEKVKIVDQNLEGSGEPTQGVIIAGSVYYISNSSWDAYEDGVYNRELSDSLKVRSFQLRD